MSRPLFEIALEIASDWKAPSPQAKAYLKGMHYLLGMDDIVADLDAGTTVRMFLLYSKEWTGAVAERIKAELAAMRSSNIPRNADLLTARPFPATDLAIATCDLCDAALGQPQKCVEAHTHWGECKHMCLHCSLFLSPGLDLGDGAVFIRDGSGAWRHLHGQPKKVAAPTSAPRTSRRTPSVFDAPLHFRIKRFGRKVVKKCAAIMQGWFRKSA